MEPRIRKSHITNEFGNKIDFEAKQDLSGVTLVVTGPTSQVEHTYTPAEIIEVMTLLAELGVKTQKQMERQHDK